MWRTALIGCPKSCDPGQLWESNLSLALALSASMPSGCATIAGIRDELCSACGLSAPVLYRPDAFPCCVHSFDLPFPANAGFCEGYIYIGSGTPDGRTGASPWGSPFGCDATNDQDGLFLEYARCRADVVFWLAPLIGKKLVCDCLKTNPNKHCMVIAQLIVDTFDVEPLPAHAKINSTFHMNDERFSFSSIYGVDSDSLGTYDLLDWSSVNRISAKPKAFIWPQIWIDLVDSVRCCGKCIV